MKMKEQTVWMAIAGFFQILFMGTGGAAAVEIFKVERSEQLIISAGFFAIGSLIIGAGIYAYVLNEIKKPKQ